MLRQCRVIFKVCDVLQISVVSTLSVSKSRALVIWSHPELEPGELDIGQVISSAGSSVSSLERGGGLGWGSLWC